MFIPYYREAARLSTARNSGHTVPEEDYDEKNRRLKRPLASHLTIYKFQSNMVLSISHRFTGMILTSLTMSLAACEFSSPACFPLYRLIIRFLKFLFRFFLAAVFWSLCRSVARHASKFVDAIGRKARHRLALFVSFHQRNSTHCMGLWSSD